MIEHSVLLDIPIYEVLLHLILDEDPQARRARPAMVQRFGPPPEGDWAGLVSAEGGEFALFISPSELRHPTTLAHEIFHLTHRILDFAGVRFSMDDQEPAALLHGYLTRLIYKELQINFESQLCAGRDSFPAADLESERDHLVEALAPGSDCGARE